MSSMKQSGQKIQKGKKTNKIIIGGMVLAVLIFGLIAYINFPGKGEKGNGEKETAAVAGDLVIKKSEITDKAKFYPVKVGKLDGEVVAVKASDGTIRTAFNTCQVCFGSGRAYYEEENGALVCQNCGNKFAFDAVEKIKGGCNPVPITSEIKTEDDSSITIKEDLLKEAEGLFENWKSQ